jgi:hypothetical protein
METRIRNLLNGLIHRLCRFISKGWVPIIFFIFYIVVNYILDIYEKSSIRMGNLYLFLTCWFNPSEDLFYNNIYKGFILNFILPIIIMVLFLYYSSNSHFVKKFNFSLGIVFLSGIFGTYTMSGVIWAYGFPPGTGTSIVAFCIVVYFIFIAFLDTRFYWNRECEKARNSISYLVIFIIFISLYINYQPTSYLHVWGFLLSIPFLIILLQYHKQ